MRIHLIAIGGSAMHNFALALAHLGHDVTGSDDQIFEPSRGRLKKVNLLPDEEGWNEDRITEDIDVIILGMHARTDNPELLKAQTLGLNIQSYPEFLYNSTKDKRRIVVGGSHGKTTITSMLLHTMSKVGKSTDYMVGAQLEGFDRMLDIQPGNEFSVIEGDEYLSSPIDRRSKFLHYKPHIAILTGIAWDHINVFPTEENYLETFREFISTIEHGGTLVYCSEDKQIKKLVDEFSSTRKDLNFVGYSTPHSIPGDGTTEVTFSDGSKLLTPLVGSHNYQNLEGAKQLCRAIGISSTEFTSAIKDFKGAAKRLEVISETKDFIAFRDFAHAPSKLKATQAGVVSSFPNRDVTAVFELHTFSSLNKEFLPTYKDSMNAVDNAIVYYDPKVVKHKRLPEISPEEVVKAFNRDNLEVIISDKELEARLAEIPRENHCVLLMSSGRFGGAELPF